MTSALGLADVVERVLWRTGSCQPDFLGLSSGHHTRRASALVHAYFGGFFVPIKKMEASA